MENMARSLLETLTNDIEIQTAATGLQMDIQFKILSEKQLQLMQFKAKQKLLHMKEESQWNEFCELQGFTKAPKEPRDYNQNYSGIPESNSETCLPSFKSIGIQVKQRQQFSAKVLGRKLQVPEGKADQSNSDSKNVHPEEAEVVILPQALDGIKKQLEDIQQNLSEFSKNTKPQEQKKHFSLNNPKISHHDKEITTAESSAENRRKILQKSLVTSFQRLQKSAKQKKFLSSPKAKQKDEKNIGFILPSVLKEQRVSARRSYLSSLPVLNSVHETRRKVLRNKNKKPEKSLHQQESRFQNSKLVPSKPVFTRDRMEENELFQQELLKENRNLPLSEFKNSSLIEEKNVDIIVDEILDDLLAETVLDLHKAEKVKKNKITEQLGYMCQKLNDIESEETAIHQKWSTVTFQNMQTNFSSETIHHPAILPTIIIKSSNAPAQKPNNGNFHLTENIRENWMQLKDEVQDRNLKTTNLSSSNGIIMSKQEQNIFQGNFHLLGSLKSNTAAQASISKTVTMQHDPDASLDNVYQLTELGVGSEVLTNIYNYKKRFHQYLHRTSLAQKGKFNPISITERISVSLLEDCLQDIAEELIEIPEALITDLYNQEFVQSSNL